MAEVVNLQRVIDLVGWDQHTQMPSAGASARSNHLAVLNKLMHECLTRPEVGRLLEKLRPYEDSLPYDSDEASTIRVARREYERATRLPPDLIVRISRARTEGLQAWLEARAAKDYKVFRPALERMYGVMADAAEALGYEGHPIDPLLDRLEPDVTVADVEALFNEIREPLVSLTREISAGLREGDDPAAVLHQTYDRETQIAVAKEAVRAIGFDLVTRGRLDFSVHPFSTTFSPNDTRITTRVDEKFFGQAFFSSLHEAGHGTYMQGIPLKFEQSILGDGASSGLHESQSRLWENVVGRSRPFWEFFYPRLQERFPSQLGGVPLDVFYRAVNKVEPSLIRVDADEVTYNLHVMIRFELEKAVFDGELRVADMAEAWNAKVEEYLGIRPPDDLVGVLQDVHWTMGFGGLFPGYTIGNVASVQLYEEALKAHPDLPARHARGDFSALLQWMIDHVHVHGAKFTPQELLRRVTGRPLTAEPYLRYIREKFTAVYEL